MRMFTAWLISGTANSKPASSPSHSSICHKTQLAMQLTWWPLPTLALASVITEIEQPGMVFTLPMGLRQSFLV